MNKNEKIQELNDYELDNVSGGANLDAWFAEGFQGAPYCSVDHPKTMMDSYKENNHLYLKCPWCGRIVQYT